MTAWSGGSIHCCLLLLLLLLPTLLLAQDDCSHNCKNEAKRYYYVRPEGSTETLCPAQPCLTPSQLREHFSECERNNSCQSANTSLVLLPGTYTSASNHGLFLPPLKYFSLTGYNQDCNTDSSANPSIDCNGTWISLKFQHIKCLHVQNCVVFTGHGTTVAVDHVTFHDSLIRLASITAADHSELDYNYTLGSRKYCLLQKQLADINALAPSNSVLALRNVSFSSDYHSTCAREHGIQLATIHATDSALDIADCLFTQNAVTHISLLHSNLHTSGLVQFENANTTIQTNNSTIVLTGVVNFYNNTISAIQALDSTIVLAGTVQFTNNTANHGGAVSLVGGSMIIADNAQVVFQNNHAITNGGAIFSSQHVTIAGSVQFINNSAYKGGAIDSVENVTIANNALVGFQNNHASTSGGAIVSYQHVTIAGSVQFINNSAYKGGAIDSSISVTIANSSQVVFRGNNAKYFGGAINAGQHVTIAGSVQFINNSAYQGGAIDSNENVTIMDNAHLVFEDNYAKHLGGAITAGQHVTITGSVQFINNTADQGGAIDSGGDVTMNNNAQVGFQNNYASSFGGAIVSRQLVTVAGSVQFINNSASQGGAIYSAENVKIANNSQIVFQGNQAKFWGGAITSSQHVIIAGSVQFINNSANMQGGAIGSEGNVTMYNDVQVCFQNNYARVSGGAIHSSQRVAIAGSVQFINNSADLGGAVGSDGNVTMNNDAQVCFQNNYAWTSGGAIFTHQHVAIAGSVQFINNSASQAGAIYSFSVAIADNSEVVIQGNQAKTRGGAIASIQQVTIAGIVQFINNRAEEGGSIDSVDVTITDNAQVVFQGNRAEQFGGAVVSGQHVTIAGSVQFIDNSAYQGGAIVSNDGMTIATNAQVKFQGNHADSEGGAIAIDSHVVLAGSVQFISNTAQLGGAISMFPGNMTVVDNAEVTFQGNHAYRVGGAIYSSASTLVYYTRSTMPCLASFGSNSTMNLLQNTAERGGSAMYGINLSRLKCNTRYSLAHRDYEYLFDIITIIPDSFSAVSSDPLRVCICPDQSTPDCLAILPDQNIPYLHYTAYPGQNFTIPAVVVGFNFALTSGSVYAQFLSSDASLGSQTQYVQGVNQTGCSQLQYSVLSDKIQEKLVLTTDGRQVGDIDSRIKEDIKIQNNNLFNDLSSFNGNLVFSNLHKYYANHTFVTSLIDGVFTLAGYVQVPLQNTPVYVSVQLLDCPPGFTLNGQHKCDCNERILTNLLTCSINNQTVRRHGNIWVNATFIGNKSSGVIVHKHCPFEFCKPEQLDVNLTHPETQCAFDHYGTLCGACMTNFSLALGSSRCLPNCSNKYLLLLIVFILAGFALVLFIKILNLTVSEGTINGLIFYANIVEANRSIFFPAQYSKVVSFLSVFISWLNLDLGIETCFIKGLDGYWKTWLQFVFPFYVWLIAGAIILASHYSTRATKIFGDNSVSVLATLLHLSYAKLLRTVIVIFSFTTLEYPDNSKVEVWSFDGNLGYFSARHIPLFLFALTTVLLLWLPYTAVLLSAQWLRTQTHRKHLRWLKPFLDAYNGPFKDKHHYWVGVLLVVRGVLFVIFAYFIAVENNVNLLLISIISLIIPIYTSSPGRLYKHIHATILENLFFLNLGVLGIGTYHIRVLAAGGNQEVLVTTSVGIAFLEFCEITIFHSYQFVILPIRKWYAKVGANDRSIDNAVQLQPLLNSDSSDDDLLEYMPRNVVTHSEICLSQLREEQDPPNPSTSAEHQLPPANRINTRHRDEMLIPFNRDTPLPNTHQENYSVRVGANGQVEFSDNTAQVLIPCTRDTPRANTHLLKLSDDAAIETKGAAVDEPPPPQESSEPRYFAAEREERFIDFDAPCETLLEYTQYRLPQERNEPARDSTTERELLSAPHEYPQESSGPRYFAAEREERFIDFDAPRETLLEYTQYRLPQERNEPARDYSTAESELLSAPHEHPQESSEPRYFSAEREGPIDFTAPRESLLDYTQ